MKKSMSSMASTSTELEQLRNKLGIAEEQVKSLLQEKETAFRMIEEVHQDWIKAFDAVPDPIFMHDRQFNITRANKAYAQKAGLKFKQFIGRPYWEIFPKLSGPLSGCIDAISQLRQGETHDQEFQLESGEFYLSRACHAFNKNDEYQYSIHFLHDITDQRAISIALSESEAKFRQICGSAQDAILMMDNEGSLSYWNPAAEKILGYTFEEVRGKNMHHLLAPERFHNTYAKGFRHFRDTGEGFAIGKTLELAAKKKDGSEFPIELSVASVKISGAWHAIGIMRDITTRKAVEHALQDSEQRFRTVVETVPDVLYRSSLPDNATNYVSPSITELLGYAVKEFHDDPHLWREILHEQDRARVLQEIEAAIRRKDAHLFQEYRVGHKNKKDILWLQNHSTFLYDNEGHPTEVIGSLNDVTKLKRIQSTLQKTSRMQRMLSYCNATLVHVTEESALLYNMCQIIVEFGGYKGAWVGYAHHDKAKTLQPMAQIGIPPGLIESLNPTWANTGFGASVIGKAIRTQKQYVMQHIDDIASPADPEWHREINRLGIKSYIAIPLLSDSKALGSLTILSEEMDAFDPQEVGMLQELADDLAFGIVTLRARAEHRKDIEAKQQYQEQISKTLESTIQAIAATVEMRDPYTAGHEQRVAELAVAIAKEMGLSEDQIEGIRVAGTVHDLGKIQVPAEILSKPRNLNDIEFSLIKTHPLMGYNILKDIDFPWPVAQMVLQHHERLDGSGYPNGIKGRSIILESRILAVADTVEAMASHRPYRASLGIQTALDEIRSGSGKLYDAKVVNACIRLFKEKGYTLIG